MANTLHLVLMAFAVVLFALATLYPLAEPREAYRYRLVAAGLLAWALAVLLGGLVK